MSNKHKWLLTALAGGARIGYNGTHDRYYILDQRGWMADASFLTAECAAEAYCDHFRLQAGSLIVTREHIGQAYALTGDPYYAPAARAHGREERQFSFWLGDAFGKREGLIIGNFGKREGLIIGPAPLLPR